MTKPKHIESLEKECREQFCQNLDIIETMPDKEQKKNRWLFIHTRDISGTPILDTSPEAYCKLTGKVCVAEEPSFWNIVFGRTVNYGNAAGITLNENRLYECPSCNYKNKNQSKTSP